MLATSPADLPLIASCHKTPTGFIFLAFQIGAKVPLNKTRHLQKIYIACIMPGSCGSMMTFCMSTETIISLLDGTLSFSSW